MSRTYRKKPRRTFRCPRGRKQAIINGVRKGATPPDTWDDISASDECWLPQRAAVRMEGRFGKTRAIHKLAKKFNLNYDEAERIIYREWASYKSIRLKLFREDGLSWEEAWGILHLDEAINGTG